MRPKMLFTLSRASRVCGTLVLQCMTAPAARRMSTKEAFFGARLKARAAMPMLESVPWMWKLSFMEMGRPWRGPRGLPVWARWASRRAARARAEWKSGSVMQEVSWWDIAARFGPTISPCLRGVRLGMDGFGDKP